MCIYSVHVYAMFSQSSSLIAYCTVDTTRKERERGEERYTNYYNLLYMYSIAPIAECVSESNIIK